MQSLTVDQNEAICRLVMAAGEQAWQSRHRPIKVFEKGNKDYVTNIDRALDQFLSQKLAALFPADGIITEENVASRQTFQSTSRYLWFIDPIDGTEEFIHQGSSYAVMVGLLEHYIPQAGWIYAPAHRRLYWGGPHWGLFYAENNGWPQVLNIKSPPLQSPAVCPVLMGYRDQSRFGKLLSQYIPGMHCISGGSFGLKVLEVIQGKAGLYFYLSGKVKLWDTVGPLALAKAAGLICCDLTGRPLVFNPDAIEPKTLAHHQAVIVGWPSYIEPLLPRIRFAVEACSV